MTAMPTTPNLLHAHYEHLMQHRRGNANEDLLAKMYASTLCGQGAMPLYLGLPLDIFRTMMEYHFPTLRQLPLPASIQPLEPERMPELDDLRALLQQNLTHPSSEAGWMVEILCAGCMGNDHLWQDLGLWSRKDLSAFMYDNFHPLASRNTKDMKWKKFLYKQLCDAEGIYVCRSPSCEVCVDYAACFGPEN
jgi:nitrogen fixation protein NifQ